MGNTFTMKHILEKINRIFESLETDALQYDSAEEFVASQQNPNEEGGLTLFGEFVSDSDLKTIKFKKGEFVGEFVFDFEGKKYKIEKIEDGLSKGSWNLFDITTDNLSERGYIDTLGSKDSVKAFLIRQSENYKNKQQLTDIWNKANKRT